MALAMSKTASKDARSEDSGSRGASKQSLAEVREYEKTCRNPNAFKNYVSLLDMYKADQKARQNGEDPNSEERLKEVADRIIADNWLVFDILAKR